MGGAEHGGDLKKPSALIGSFLRLKAFIKEHWCEVGEVKVQRGSIRFLLTETLSSTDRYRHQNHKHAAAGRSMIKNKNKKSFFRYDESANR